MTKRKIGERVWLLGAVDWNRRLFDSLIPLPDGTSYNAYPVRGSGKDFETLNTLADAVAQRHHGLAPAAEAGP